MKFEKIEILIYVFAFLLIESKISVGNTVVNYNGDIYQNEKSTSEGDFYKAQNLLPTKDFSAVFPIYGHGYSIKSGGLPVNGEINDKPNQDLLRGKLGILLPWKHNLQPLFENNLVNFKNAIGANGFKTPNSDLKRELQKRVKRQTNLDNAANDTSSTFSSTSLINSGKSNQITTVTSTPYESTVMDTQTTTANQITVSQTSKHAANSVSEQLSDTEGSGVVNEDNITLDGNSVIKNNSNFESGNNSSKGNNSVSNATTTEPVSRPEQTPDTTFAHKTQTEPSTISEPEKSPELSSSTAEPISKSEPTTLSEPISEPELYSSPEPSAKPKVYSSPEPVTGSSSTKSEPEPKSTAEPETTPESTPEPVATPESTPEPEKTSASTPEPETTAESTPEPEKTSASTAEPETTAESMPEPVTTAESTPEPEQRAESTPEPEIKAESTSEPETTAEHSSDPEFTSEPKSEPESTSEPESEPEPESGNAFAEPSPIWHIAKEEWRWGWEFLIYFFGVMFILLGLFSFISVVRLWRMNHLLSKNYFLTLNILIIVKCALRGSYLLVDGYNANDTFHDILNYFLYSTAFPCLTSAFSILFYALLLATKMQVISTRIQKLPILIGIIGFHFALSIITDVVVGLFSDARILLLVCQFFYILWGLVLFAAYFYIFRKLYHSAVKRQKAMAQQTSSNNSNEKPKKMHKLKYTLSLSVKVTFLAALFGLGCVALELYGIFGVYKIYRPGHTPEPWPWWIYQFSLRTMEFLMCLTMVYVASQPIKYQKRKGDGICSLYILPFKRVCCCCCKDDSSSDGDLTWASSNAIALPSSHSDNYKFPKHKKNNKNNKQGIYALEKNGSAKPVKLTHIVIEDGRVRFKSEEDITDNSSELGTSLPDLVNGNVVKDEIYETEHSEKSNNKQSNGVYNVGFNETEGINYRNEKLTQVHNNHLNNSENRNHKQSIDLDGSSIGTLGTDIGRPLSSLNLADSMEFEFEKVYERSFVGDETNSIKSLPNILSVNTTEDSINSNLLSNMSPDHQCTEFNHDQVSFSSGPNDSSVSGGPNSPTRKPLIQGTRRRSSFEFLNSFQAQTKL